MKIKFSKICSKDILLECVLIALIYLIFYQYVYMRDLVLIKVAIAVYFFCGLVIRFITKNIYHEKFVVGFIIYNIFLFIVKGTSPFCSMLYLPIAIELLERKTLKKGLCYCCGAGIVIDVLSAYAHSINGYLLYDDISRNYISIFALFGLAIINLSYEKKKQRCPFVLIILNLFVSVIAIGRGGIIASVVLFLFMAYKNFFIDKRIRGVKKTFYSICLLVFLTIGIFFIIKNWQYITDKYLYRLFGRVATAKSSNEARIYIITSYFNQCATSIVDFLFGVDANLNIGGKLNFHNSFMQIHSEWGLLGLVVFIYKSCVSVVYLWREKFYDSAIIFFIILLRSLTDWCYPGFLMDIIIIYYLLFPTFREKKFSLFRSNK